MRRRSLAVLVAAWIAVEANLQLPWGASSRSARLADRSTAPARLANLASAFRSGHRGGPSFCGSQRRCAVAQITARIAIGSTSAPGRPGGAGPATAAPGTGTARPQLTSAPPGRAGRDQGFRGRRAVQRRTCKLRSSRRSVHACSWIGPTSVSRSSSTTRLAQSARKSRCLADSSPRPELTVTGVRAEAGAGSLASGDAVSVAARMRRVPAHSSAIRSRCAGSE